MKVTERLYLQDDDLLEVKAVVIDATDGAIAVDRTCFYPGGGGQPSDTGKLILASGQTRFITGVASDEYGVLWHSLNAAVARQLVRQTVTLVIDQERRNSFSRYHTVLHVLNTIALRDYGAWMTGAQISMDYSRIDFKMERFTKEVAAELEAKVNAVISVSHGIHAYYLSEAEFNARDELLRTLKVRPPVVDGRVRVVEIQDFDSQACGGTHVHNTLNLGHFSIFKLENNGRINKRFYIRLS